MNKQKKYKSINELQQLWNKFAPVFSKFDSADASLYFTLINMMDIPKAKNILQIGCGRGSLIPFCLELKSPEAIYYATDLSSGMIAEAEKRLKSASQLFQSKLSYEDWLKKNKLTLKVANGEQVVSKQIKFDRIICNHVLMLTTDASKMLQSMYEEAAQGCIVGISIPGNTEQNQYKKQIKNIFEELKVQQSDERDDDYLYNKVPELAAKVGWKTVATWEQVSTFPYLFSNMLQMFGKGKINHHTTLTQEQKKWAFQEYMKRTQKRLKESNRLLTAPNQIIILRK